MHTKIESTNDPLQHPARIGTPDIQGRLDECDAKVLTMNPLWSERQKMPVIPEEQSSVAGGCVVSGSTHRVSDSP
jgi:hypothetical protein